MPTRLSVGKIVVGAFVIPWRDRKYFARALVIPLLTLVALLGVWRSTSANLSSIGNWLFYLAYGAVFSVLAICCHRLVLLGPKVAAPTLFPAWSGRETRFFLLLVAVSVISFAVRFTLDWLATRIWNVHWQFDPAWFGRIDAAAQ